MMMNDPLRVFRGGDYQINQHITMRQPTLDEICNYGEREYYFLIQNLCATPADHKLIIWESMKTYWEQIDEYLWFIQIFNTIKMLDMSIIFRDLNAESFQIVENPKVGELVLRNEDGIVIDRAIHHYLTDYLRQVHRLKKNVDTGYNNSTRDAMIEDDKDARDLAAKKPYQSILLPLISAMTNSSEFKYRFDDVWSLPIGAFMDSVERVQKNKNYEHLMHGVYSGSIDAKSISKKELMWIS